MSDPGKINSASAEDAIRPHSFDGIQEYDKRLPNWWLFTLYGAIAYALVYWFYYEQSGVGRDDKVKFALEMQAVEAARLASSAGAVDDDQIWTMSKNAQIVAAGKATFTTNCVACHLASLRGKDENPTAVGPDLVDNIWLHGNKPMDLRNTVTKGVLEKGMPTWGPVLGEKKILEVVAYVLSHHKPGPDGGAIPAN